MIIVAGRLMAQHSLFTDMGGDILTFPPASLLTGLLHIMEVSAEEMVTPKMSNMSKVVEYYSRGVR